AAYCWGRNVKGRLGIGGQVNIIFPQPTAVSRPPFVMVAAGLDHTCGLTSTHDVYCWGDNLYGELGIGSSDFDSHVTPQLVPGGVAFIQISAGRYHTCGVASDNRTYCWGNNGSGQLGDGSTTNRTAPTPVLST